MVGVALMALSRIPTVRPVVRVVPAPEPARAGPVSDRARTVRRLTPVTAVPVVMVGTPRWPVWPAVMAVPAVSAAIRHRVSPVAVVLVASAATASVPLPEPALTEQLPVVVARAVPVAQQPQAMPATADWVAMAASAVAAAAVSTGSTASWVAPMAPRVESAAAVRLAATVARAARQAWRLPVSTASDLTAVTPAPAATAPRAVSAATV